MDALLSISVSFLLSHCVLHDAVNSFQKALQDLEDLMEAEMALNAYDLQLIVSEVQYSLLSFWKSTHDDIG